MRGLAEWATCMSAVKFGKTAWLGSEVMNDNRPSDDADRITPAVHGKEVTPDTPFLVDPPGPDADVRGLVCLDFDGVLNKLGPGRRDRLPQVVENGHSLGIDLDADIVARLDTVIQRPGIWLAWTTTWGSQISLARHLFDGHLEGGFVTAERPPGFYVDIGWKEQAVLRLAEQFPDAKLAWIDDTAVPESFRYGTATRRLPLALLIAPDAATGLQIKQITAIGEYFGTLGAETP
jgi:hypothetical protein